MASRDRAFARLVAATVIRHFGSLGVVVDRFLEKPLPPDARRARLILLAAAAQLLDLRTPPHAAISLAVEQCQRDASAHRFARLVNAVARRVATEGPAVLVAIDRTSLDVPSWMLARWTAAYGPEAAHRIAEASLREAAIDLSVKSDAAEWAVKLGGMVLPTGSVRLSSSGRIEDLDGYADGAWWVQDAAAALPARALGDVAGKEIADLCAAPGGKTMELAAAGAKVTAVDQSPSRMRRLEANLARTGLRDAVETVVADVETWTPGRTFDAVLLDAPCTATGTIRRHPDILHAKTAEDIARLSAQQARLLDAAAALVKPGGMLVFCTCSLEPEEGVEHVPAFLAAHPKFRRFPIKPREIGAEAGWITADGDLRTFPHHLTPPGDVAPGLDGFYVARFKRRAR
jgi:16S rRNA (cytosine967-C5)-methyltransferase